MTRQIAEQCWEELQNEGSIVANVSGGVIVQTIQRHIDAAVLAVAAERDVATKQVAELISDVDWEERFDGMKAECEKAQAGAAAYRAALEGMVSQYGGDETCMSANEDAVEVLESRDAGKDFVAELARLGACNDAEFKLRREAQKRVEQLTAELQQANDAVLRAGRDPRWAAVYSWLDDNKDAVVKRLGDLTGTQEIELARLRAANAEIQTEYDNARNELGDEIATISTLLDDAQAKVKEQHRTIQRLDGIAEHQAKLHESFGLSLKWAHEKAHRWREQWRGRYMAAVKQLIAAGVSDHVDWLADGLTMHRPHGATDLAELIRRLIEQRRSVKSDLAKANVRAEAALHDKERIRGILKAECARLEGDVARLQREAAGNGP